jgi:hypothetical protein
VQILRNDNESKEEKNGRKEGREGRLPFRRAQAWSQSLLTTGIAHVSAASNFKPSGRAAIRKWVSVSLKSAL